MNGDASLSEPGDASDAGDADETAAPVTSDARQRLLRWAPRVGLGLVAVAIVAVGLLVLYDRSLDRVPVDGLADEERSERDGDATITVEDGDGGGEAPDGLGSPLHVLVAASDDRSVLTREERSELSTGDAAGERTEALALVRVDPGSDRIDVLRFPRDLLVTRCDGSRGRINAAYAIGERDGVGGASCLVETVTTWSGLPIHHVVMIDFRGFVDAVDSVGGVELVLDEPLYDRRAGLDLPAGCVRLDGADALAFVRARHLDDDFGRIQRQQRLVAETLDQVLTTSTLRDPRRLGQLLTTAQRSLQLDDRLTARRMRAIAATVGRIGSDGMVSRSIGGEVRTSSEGIAFLYPDEEHADQLFSAFAAGELDRADDGGRDEVAGVPGGDSERTEAETAASDPSVGEGAGASVGTGASDAVDSSVATC